MRFRRAVKPFGHARVVGVDGKNSGQTEKEVIMPSHWDVLPESLRATVAESVAEYERIRPELERVSAVMAEELTQIFADSDVKPLFIDHRTKSVESFRQKASRTYYLDGTLALQFPDPMRTLNDLVGVRIIVALPGEISVAANLIKRQRNSFDCRGDTEKDIGSIESGTYGYSSRHLILRTVHNQAVQRFQDETGHKGNGSLMFECQLRTIFSHAWSEIEHDIRFKAEDRRAWSPSLDRQFTATAAMLEQVEATFSELHDRYDTITGYWDESGDGSRELTPETVKEVWQTLLPHVDRKSDDDWRWALELLNAHGLHRVYDLAELLQAESISHVRKALAHRYSPGPDRLLDDVLLWRYGQEHIDLTAAGENHRRESLDRRWKQMLSYRKNLEA